MTTTVKTAQPPEDPLGYEGTVLQRVRKMAQDELARVNSAGIEEDAAVQEALNRPEIGCDWQALQKRLRVAPATAVGTDNGNR